MTESDPAMRIDYTTLKSGGIIMQRDADFFAIRLRLPGGPCYRCIFKTPPPPGSIPSCQEAGVFGILPGIIGTIQASEALKFILGIGEPLAGRLLCINTLDMTFYEAACEKRKDCAICRDQPEIRTGFLDDEELARLRKATA